MDHPIHELLKVSLENIKEMIDANTIVGSPINNIDNSIIIPISKVIMGFASGGSEFSPKATKMPFGGGTGGSLSISPVALLVISGNDIRLLAVGEKSGLYESMFSSVPKLATEAMNLIAHSLQE